MFWSGNYVAVRELNFLLKEDHVTLSQVLEADDILQECKADNKNLIQFITRPEILAELITLITEEPSKNVELASQYRHASIACEVLTSHLSMLSDRLSLDAVQMNRLCDFLKQEPPLNPLLASYFSQTVEMLLERSPKQDCYLYHIVCLRVLDFFKSRRDFLPNLLRHISTSAIADVFKYFIRLDDLFHKTVIEWLDEHQFLECLIQIICGSYEPEPLEPAPATNCGGEGAPAGADEAEAEGGEHKEKGDNEPSEKVELNHVGEQQEQPAGGADTSDTKVQNNKEESSTKVVEWKRTEDEIEAERRMREVKAERIRAVAAHNATELLCELLLNGCAGEGCSNRGCISSEVVGRVRSAEFAESLLQQVFTAARPAPALQRAARLLAHQLSLYSMWLVSKRCGVERALAPHLPLLHQALLVAPAPAGEGGEGGEGEGGPAPVGGARVAVAGLLAQLALSVVQEVAETIITLGTATVLVDLLARHGHNTFLSAHVYAFIKHALANNTYSHQYAKHLLIECDILNRFMDLYEENEYQTNGRARAGYMGHVILALQRVQRALNGPLAEPQADTQADGLADTQAETQADTQAESQADTPAPQLAGPIVLPEPLKSRWEAFNEQQLIPKLRQHETPLGGYYPSDNTYEAENMVDPLEAVYEYKDGDGLLGADLGLEGEDEGVEGVEAGEGRGEQAFISVVMQRLHRDQEHWWDDTPEGDAEEGEGEREVEGEEQFQQVADQVLAASSPWDAADEATPVGEGWASFGDAFGDPAPAPAGTSPAGPAPTGPAPAGPAPAASCPAADVADDDDFSPFWGYTNNKEDHTANSPTKSVEHSLQSLRLDGEDAWGEALDSASSVSLANNLLTAMSSMTPDVIANIVNANLDVLQDNINLNTTTQATQQDTAADVQASTENEQTKLQNTSELDNSNQQMAGVANVAGSDTSLASGEQATSETEAGQAELSER